jgi:dipeptidyl aminopeptidase/acylaminoacyl peptidase
MTVTAVRLLDGQSAARSPVGAERLLQEAPAVWFEEYWSTLEVSTDGQRILYTSPFTGRIRLLDPRTQGAPEAVAPADLTDLRGATLGPGGTLAVFGTSAGKPAWYVEERGKPVRLALPPDARSLAWSPDGQQLAFSRDGVADSVFAGPVRRPRSYPLAGTVTGLSWLPGGGAFLALSRDARGVSTLVRVEPPSGRTVALARDLDAPTFVSPVPVAPDGRRAYVALASPGPPDPELRHEPRASRHLGIYEVDLATGARRPVVPARPGADAYTPSVAKGHLYWVEAATDASIVVVPMVGGDARVVARGAMVPSWRPDGRQIGFAYGDWRWADLPLNWEGGAVDVDANGRARSAPQPVIVGYHEDFQPVWSPSGEWIAYHSHRTKTSVGSFAGGSEADDIWLRRAGAPPRDTTETRLTNFGIEANSPDWSRDGTRLVFTSWAKEGPPGVSFPYVVTIDTIMGRAVRHGRLPLPKEIRNTTWVAYSPVNDDVALESDLGKGRHALWIVASTGAKARKIVEYPLSTFGGVSWTPDGRTLVYTALVGGHMQLFAVPAAGGTPRQLTHDAANVFTPRVSPDGRFIAATRIAHRKEIWRVPLPK